MGAAGALFVILTATGCRHSNPGAGIYPRTQAVHFFAAAKAMDWKSLYDLSEAASHTFSSAAEYDAKMSAGIKTGFLGIIYQGMFVTPEIKIGEAAITGAEAEIP